MNVVFSKNGRKQYGSYLSLQYVSVADVATDFLIMDDNNTLITPLFLFQGVQWITMPLHFGQKSYEILNKEDKQGDVTDITIKGFVDTSVMPFSIQKAVRMKRQDYLVRLTLPSSISVLMSTPSHPAKFDFKIEGGNLGKDQPNISFVFKSNLLQGPIKF